MVLLVGPRIMIYQSLRPSSTLEGVRKSLFTPGSHGQNLFLMLRLVKVLRSKHC